MYKNVVSQKLLIYAHDSLTDSAKTGDAANITAQISQDGGAAAASNDTNPTELDATNLPGVYAFDLTQAETNCDLLALSAVSSTSAVVVEPIFIYPKPDVIGADGDTLEDLSDQIDAIPTVGSGAISVDHDTGGADNLAYEASGVGINGATVEAYLKTDYDAGNYGAAYLKGLATTDVNGQWEEPMKLDAATYTFLFYKQNEYGPDTKEQAVS